jgi:hypothetical protein
MATLPDHAVFQTIRRTWRRALQRPRSLVEPAACPHPGRGGLLPRRLELLGLDPGYIRCAQSAAYRDMERACAICRVWRLCERDLAKGDAQGGMDSYCLNSEALDSLTVAQARSRPM